MGKGHKQQCLLFFSLFLWCKNNQSENQTTITGTFMENTQVQTHLDISERPKGKFNTMALSSPNKVCQKPVICRKLTCMMNCNI